MNTVASQKHFRWIDSKRRFLFLALGIVLGIGLVYGLPCTNDPTISALIGVGLLAGVVAIKTRHKAEKDAEFSRQ